MDDLTPAKRTSARSRRHHNAAARGQCISAALAAAAADVYGSDVTRLNYLKCLMERTATMHVLNLTLLTMEVNRTRGINYNISRPA